MRKQGRHCFAFERRTETLRVPGTVTRGSRLHGQVFSCLAQGSVFVLFYTPLGVELCPPKRHVEVLTTMPVNVNLLRNRVFYRHNQFEMSSY